MIFILLLLYGVFARPDLPFADRAFTRDELDKYKNEAKELIYFGIDKYLDVAYPADGIHPLSCTPEWRNFEDPEDFGTNDVMGNFSLTLIDSLTTVAVIGDRDKFKQLVDLVAVSFPNKFDVGSVVQVFESTIRILGSLMSAHLYATDPSKKVYLGGEYDGFMLDLAVDLADRLLPAFLTDQGIPYPRTNLSGSSPLDVSYNANNNIVAMSSTYFEFRMLSYLTKDSKYEEVTKFSFEKAWNMRSYYNLVPSIIDPYTGYVIDATTGVGASVDSFYEYILKGAILFDDDLLLKRWHEAYSAISVNAKEEWFFTVITSYSPTPIVNWIDSLAAFFPGLEVLAGYVDEAMAHNMMYMKLWDTYGAIPERWYYDNTESEEYLGESIQLGWYGLRPEFIESSWYLYRATKDPLFLNIAHRVLQDYKTRFKTACGFASIKDVLTGELEDKMESFVLSETLKYLFLLFDEDNELHTDRGNVVFSTEAHPLWLSLETKLDYEQNKYFNDTVYIKHLERVRKIEDKRLRDARYGINNEMYRLQRDFLNWDAPLDRKSRKSALRKLSAKKAAMDRSPEEDYIQQRRVHNEFNNTCPISQYDSGRHHGRGRDNCLLFSPIMSNYGKLFAIDRRYHATLNRPEYLAGSAAIEIEPLFYDRWCPPTAQCQPQTTAATYEVIFESIGSYDIVRYPNGSVSGESFSGRRKLRIELLRRGDIDNYGDVVTDADFKDLSLEDTRPGRSPGQRPGNPVSTEEIYRVIRMDGIPIPKGQEVYIDSRLLADGDFDVDDVIADPYIDGKKNAFKNFGFNKDGQLINDNIVITNFKII